MSNILSYREKSNHFHSFIVQSPQTQCVSADILPRNEFITPDKHTLMHPVAKNMTAAISVNLVFERKERCQHQTHET